ncbi:MAG: arylsulfatase [Rikenellaceae bacterium]
MLKLSQNYVSSYACCSMLLLTAACSTNEQKAKSQKPNVVLIMTDDQGWGDFGFNGNENIHTPMLDSLSEVSAHLTNFYVSPLSSTSRAGLITGRNHLRTGTYCVTRAAENMDTEETTIAEVFKENGYATGCFGKWHNGASYPQDANGQGFDEFIGFETGHLTYYFDSELIHNQEPFKATGYITDALTDYALDFIAKNKDNPFLCYIPYNAPHGPYQVPDEYYDKYAHLSTGEKDPTPAVYAMCENLDDNLRRLFAGVDELGLSDNTIFVYLPDNGPNNARYNGELRGVKGDVWDGGFKVPCLIYWKGKVVPAKIDKTLSYIDVMPTILDLCGIEFTPEEGRELDGVSFSSLISDGENLEAEKKIDERLLYTHRSLTDEKLESFNSVLFNSTYRLLRRGEEVYELYNIVKDPSQKENLVTECPELFEELKGRMRELMADIWVDFEDNSWRYINVGYLDYPVNLPGHEAYLEGSAKYFINPAGWAGDWATNVHSGDRIQWNISVATAGEYSVSLQYALKEGSPTSSVGAKTHLSKTGLKELPHFTSVPCDTHDRIKIAVHNSQSWNTIDLGVISLKEGVQSIEIDLGDSKGELFEGLEIKGLNLTKR